MSESFSWTILHAMLIIETVPKILGMSIRRKKKRKKKKKKKKWKCIAFSAWKTGVKGIGESDEVRCNFSWMELFGISYLDKKIKAETCLLGCQFLRPFNWKACTLYSFFSKTQFELEKDTSTDSFFTGGPFCMSITKLQTPQPKSIIVLYFGSSSI